MKLTNKTALITGGNSGIGLATARLFVAEGARAAITGRNQTTLDAAAKELGPDVSRLGLDDYDVEVTESVIATVVEKVGNLDIVFANVGIPGSTPVGTTTLAAFEAVLYTNLTGVFFTVQAAAPYLNSGASVVLTGSVHSVLGAPGYSAYAASKASVRAVARALVAERSPRGIRVNVVTPGATRMPMWSSVVSSPEALMALEQRLARGVPLGRLGEADEVAKTVLFLASADASHVQAAEIVIDGGTTGAPSGAPLYQR